MTLPRDTTPEARERQLAILRRMDGATRLEMACQMSDDARAISEAGIRHRHPEWTEEQVREELNVLLLGEDLAHKVAARRRQLART